MDRFAVALAVSVVACAGTGAQPSVPRAATPVSSTPIACCATAAALAAADGQRVDMVGTYRPRHVVKRRAGAPAGDDRDARTVAIEGDARDAAPGLSVMLGIYYSPRALRPVDELARWAGKRVRVVGRLHAHTPSQTEDAIVMQTMTGPYLDEIEAISEAE